MRYKILVDIDDIDCTSKFIQLPMSILCDGYMVNNNNNTIKQGTAAEREINRNNCFPI